MGKHTSGINCRDPLKRPHYVRTSLWGDRDERYPALPVKRWGHWRKRDSIAKRSIKTNRNIQRQRS